jgi:hypothetical protein
MTDPTQNPAATAEEAAQRIRAMTEQVIEQAKKSGNWMLDAYAEALQNLIDFEQKAAGATQIEWVSTIAQAHAKFMEDVSQAYVTAARDMLK